MGCIAMTDAMLRALPPNVTITCEQCASDRARVRGRRARADGGGGGGTSEAWTRSAEHGARVCASGRVGVGERTRGVWWYGDEGSRSPSLSSLLSTYEENIYMTSATWRATRTEGWEDVRAVSDLDLLSTPAMQRRAASSRWPSPLALPAAVYIPHLL